MQSVSQSPVILPIDVTFRHNNMADSFCHINIKDVSIISLLMLFAIFETLIKIEQKYHRTDEPNLQFGHFQRKRTQPHK